MPSPKGLLEEAYTDAVRRAWKAKPADTKPHVLRARDLRKRIGDERAFAIIKELLIKELLKAPDA